MESSGFRRISFLILAVITLFCAYLSLINDLYRATSMLIPWGLAFLTQVPGRFFINLGDSESIFRYEGRAADLLNRRRNSQLAVWSSQLSLAEIWFLKTLGGGIALSLVINFYLSILPIIHHDEYSISTFLILSCLTSLWPIEVAYFSLRGPRDSRFSVIDY